MTSRNMTSLVNLRLEDIIDKRQLQSMMDDFHSFTGLPGSIIDMEGKVLVGVGWQEICTKFHRAHPETLKHCIESDTELSRLVSPGTFRTYTCKNNIRDIVTPIVVDDIHIGNLFMGQFFFEDDKIDYEFFRFQARKYGFDEQKYIACLEKIPRFKRKDINRVMSFYIKLAHMISELGYSNMRFSQILEEREMLVIDLKEKERKQYQAKKELKRNEARLQSLVNLFQYDTESSDELRDYAFKEAIKLTGSKLGHFNHYDEDKQEFSLFSYSEDVKSKCSIKRYGKIRKLDETGIWAETVRQRKPIIINNYQDYNPLKRGQPKGHLKIYRYLSVPVFRENKIVAVMGVANKDSDYTQTDSLQLSLFIDNIWKALERKWAEEKIRYLSFHDNLTGLCNRAYLEEKIQNLENNRQLPISIIMSDLNGLKLVNDTYGHLVGDEILKKIAAILTSSCRQSDVVARWGGDEFVILLPQTSEEEARAICKRISNNCLDVYIKDISISLAVGTATTTSTTKDLREVLKEAENDMYKQKLVESRSTRSSVVNTLLKTLEAKSYETEAHALRMQEAAFKIGEELGLPQSELKRLKLAITLHDIGKINIAESILTKKGPLTPKEWESIKEHPEVGYRIACATEEFAHVAKDILAHHERWDGKGYPQGLKGEEIPLLARITAIVDAYEVMTNGRPYKKAMSSKEITAELKRCAGTQFDPKLVEVFLRTKKDFDR